MSDSLNKLSPRKRKYVKALAQGKTKKAAALEAGYSESTADVAKSHIETPDVRQAFQEIIRKRIPAEKIAQRIDEGLDALETQVFSHVVGSKLKGNEKVEVTKVDKIAWSERRQYAALAAVYGGYTDDAGDAEKQVEVRLVIEHIGQSNASVPVSTEAVQTPSTV